MSLVLDKEWYRPGDIIEGRIFFEIFIPSFQTKLHLKFEGLEEFPVKYYAHVFDDINNGGGKLGRAKYESITVDADEIRSYYH